jgi:hypothetical protein
MFCLSLQNIDVIVVVDYYVVTFESLTNNNLNKISILLFYILILNQLMTCISKDSIMYNDYHLFIQGKKT